MAETKADYVAAKLRAKRWKQADLVRETGLDKNTISDFMTGKRKASLDTLGKIEDALDLTRGTLAALGEDAQSWVPPADLLNVQRRVSLASWSSAELLAELGHRFHLLEEEVWRLRSGQEEFEIFGDAETEPMAADPTAQEQPPIGKGQVVTFPAGHGTRPLDWDDEQAGHLQINPFAKPEPQGPQEVERKQVPRPEMKPRRQAARRVRSEGKARHDEDRGE